MTTTCPAKGPAGSSTDTVLKEFKPSGTQYALAVRLTGKFKTAFPDGKPEDKKDDTKDKPAEKKTGDSLKEMKRNYEGYLEQVKNF